MQIQGLEAIRGAEISREAAGRAAISVDLDDLYLADEPVELRARLINMCVHPRALIARIEPIAAAGSTIEAEFREVDDRWVLAADALPPGLFRIATSGVERG